MSKRYHLLLSAQSSIIKAIVNTSKDYVDEYCFKNLNLRGNMEGKRESIVLGLGLDRSSKRGYTKNNK